MGYTRSIYSIFISLAFLLLFKVFSGTYFIKLHDLVEFSSIQPIMLYSGVVLALLSLWTLNQRTTRSSLQLAWYLIFAPLVYIFVSTTNILVLFMSYEFFLLPSFLLLFIGSPNRRGVLSSIYFLMWTQVGSFLVFIGIIVVYLSINSFEFHSLSSAPSIAIYTALIGFGIKVPAWPAHYWLTKTHVEAPTYFSVYLSGFLVKTALYGVWVLTSYTTCVNQNLMLAIACIGVIDSSIKMWAQVDLKKLVAYGTIQEMNLILVGILLGTTAAVKAVSLFILAHTILSTMFFILADSIYKRFSSRSVTAVRGLLNASPSLGYTIFICCLLFAGLPFTLKFVVEVYVFVQLFSLNVSLLVVVMLICNWVGTVSFSKNWFSTLFGSTTLVPSDLSAKELFIFINLIFLLIILSFVSIYLL